MKKFLLFFLLILGILILGGGIAVMILPEEKLKVLGVLGIFLGVFLILKGIALVLKDIPPTKKVSKKESGVAVDTT